MATMRPYPQTPKFSGEYERVRAFLMRLDSHNYHWGRWDWMLTLIASYGDEHDLQKVGLWEDNGELVALATYDTNLGGAYLLALPDYEHLKEEMLLYAQAHLSKDGKFRALILDGDVETQNAAARHGYFPTQDKECDSLFPIGERSFDYALPSGFHITSIRETPDYYNYGRALWKGFDHEQNGEGAFAPTAEEMENYRLVFERPNVNMDLKIAVVAPNGHFVSYCGMWYEPGTQSALVEPVATDPAYRKLGLGRAAVLEGVKRCAALGAKRAFVGSSQQFYYSIGFQPHATSSWWEKKAK